MPAPKRIPHTLTATVAAGARAAAGVARLNPTDLAVELGTTRQRVNRWLNGDVAMDTDTVGRLADALGVDPVNLIRPPGNE